EHAYVIRIPGCLSQNQRAFVAHVDSVHNRQFMHKRQPVGFDATRCEFFVSDDKQRDCLGADDAAGCYVPMRMIDAQVQGLYVCFHSEERGGIGTRYVEAHRSDLFDRINQAFQLDRRGTGSIITEMMCGRTCSDEYGSALGEEIGMVHKL